jgi:hypothetical protein
VIGGAVQSDPVCAARRRFFHFWPVLVVEVGGLLIATKLRAQLGCVGLRLQDLNGRIGRRQPSRCLVEIADHRRESNPPRGCGANGIDPPQEARYVKAAWSQQKRMQFVDQDEVCRSEQPPCVARRGTNMASIDSSVIKATPPGLA